MTSTIIQWAIRNGVSHIALEELRLIFHMDAPPVPTTSAEQHSEAYVQSTVRIEAAMLGNIKLWRNNSGVAIDSRGVPVRYGLANDSPVINAKVKSADLIGWRKVEIRAKHVGSHIGQFVSRECKPPEWRYTGSDREQAQLRWIEAITADGGDASFATGKGTL